MPRATLCAPYSPDSYFNLTPDLNPDPDSTPGAVPVPEHPTADIVDAKGDVVMPDTQPGGGSVGREAFRARQQARARRVAEIGATGGAGGAGVTAGVRTPSLPDLRPSLIKLQLTKHCGRFVVCSGCRRRS